MRASLRPSPLPMGDGKRKGREKQMLPASCLHQLDALWRRRYRLHDRIEERSHHLVVAIPCGGAARCRRTPMRYTRRVRVVTDARDHEIETWNHDDQAIAEAPGPICVARNIRQLSRRVRPPQ